MGKIINGVPDAVVFVGGAVAIYWFFIRDPDPYRVGSQFRARTEREKYLAATEGQRIRGQGGKQISARYKA